MAEDHGGWRPTLSGRDGFALVLGEIRAVLGTSIQEMRHGRCALRGLAEQVGDDRSGAAARRDPKPMAAARANMAEQQRPGMEGGIRYSNRVEVSKIL
jgi:hypothetical protein